VTTTTTTALFKSYLWIGTSDNTLNEVQYNLELATSVYSGNLNSPVDKILLAENENKMYVSTPAKLYTYAVDYCQTENQVKQLIFSTNTERALIDNYKNSYIWAVQAYNNKVTQMDPSDLSVVTEYSEFDAPFKIVESKYHKAYFVGGTHILWKIDQTTNIVSNIYSIGGYNLVDFDVSESGVVCMLFDGVSDNIVRVLKNDLYSLMLNEKINGNLRFCKYCNEGKFYFISELDMADSYSYSATHYVYDSNAKTLGRFSSSDSVSLTTTTTTSGTTSDAVQITYPIGAEQLEIGHDIDVKWISSKSLSDFVKIELYKGNVYNSTISSKTENTGIFGWKIPANTVEGYDYKIQITWLSASSNPSNVSMSGNFAILSAVPVTTTTTTTLLTQKAVGIDYDKEVNWVVIMLGSGSFMVFDLTTFKVYGLIDSGVQNAVCVAARTAKVRVAGVQSKVRVYVGSQQYQNDKWDSGVVETTLKSIYYGGGNNLQPGQTYWLHIQTYSEESGWSELQIRQFTMAK
jgi:hypothetical protein